MERASASRQVSWIVDVAVVPSPRQVGTRRPLRGEGEESKVAIGHVAVLGAEQEPRHHRIVRMTVDDHCASHILHAWDTTTKSIRRIIVLRDRISRKVLHSAAVG